MSCRLTIVALCVGCLILGGAAPVPAQEQKGTLIVALDTLGAQTMDPILEGRAPQAHYQAPVFDSLVGFDYAKGGIGPGVAERWEIAADGSFWTFYLRPGLKWHNGDPLTAEDVKFSLERTVSPESVSSNAAALRRNMQRIEVVDERTVRVYTHGILPYFPESLSRAVFQEGQMMPKKIYRNGRSRRIPQKACRQWPLEVCPQCAGRSRRVRNGGLSPLAWHPTLQEAGHFARARGKYPGGHGAHG